MEFTGATAWTFFASSFPIFFRFKIAIPKWPSLALAWSGVVDLALPCLIIEKNTISIAEFFKTATDADLASVLVDELLQR